MKESEKHEVTPILEDVVPRSENLEETKENRVLSTVQSKAPIGVSQTGKNNIAINDSKVGEMTVANGATISMNGNIQIKDFRADTIVLVVGQVSEELDVKLLQKILKGNLDDIKTPYIRNALDKIENKEEFFKPIVSKIRARCLLEYTYKDEETVNAAKDAIKGTDSVKKAKDRFYVFLSAKTENKDGTKTLEYKLACELNEFLQNLGIGCFWWEDVEDQIDGINEFSDKIAFGLAFSSIFVGLAFDTVTKQSNGKYVYNSLLASGEKDSSYQDTPNYFEYESSTFRQLMSNKDNNNESFINGGRDDKLLEKEEFEEYVPKSRKMFFFTYGAPVNGYLKYPAINGLDTLNNSFISKSKYCNRIIAMCFKNKREILKHIISTLCYQCKTIEDAVIDYCKKNKIEYDEELPKEVVVSRALKCHSEKKNTVPDRKMPWWRPAVSSLGFVALAVLFSFIVQNLECMQWGMMNTLYPSLNHLFNVIQWLPIILVVIVQAVFLIWWRIGDKEIRDHAKIERDKKRAELAKVESRRATLCSIWGVLVPYLVFVVCVGISYAVN